jgi:hypothetical protein
MRRALGFGAVAAALFMLTSSILPQMIFSIEVDYVKGDVSFNRLQGGWKAVKPGQELGPGDVIRTGAASEVSLIDEGMVINVMEKSTFTVAEKYTNDEKKESFMLFLGRVKFKLARSGKGEPEVSTQTVNLAVRGTDFEVGSGYDGSTIVLLSEGAVAVAGAALGPSRGAASELLLEEGEGTEIPFGGEPTTKFKVMTRVIDWDGWFTFSKEAIKGNETDLLARILVRFEGIRDEIKGYEETKSSSLREKDEQIRRRDEMQKQGKKEEAAEFSRLAAQKSKIAFHSTVNIRFLALSSIGLFDLAAGIYSSVAKPPRDLADIFETIKSIFRDIESNYLLKGDRERLEKKAKKKK